MRSNSVEVRPNYCCHVRTTQRCHVSCAPQRSGQDPGVLWTGRSHLSTFFVCSPLRCGRRMGWRGMQKRGYPSSVLHFDTAVGGREGRGCLISTRMTAVYAFYDTRQSGEHGEFLGLTQQGVGSRSATQNKTKQPKVARLRLGLKPQAVGAVTPQP